MARRSFSEFGNALYTGEKSINFIGRRKTWYLVSLVLILICLAGALIKGQPNFGIEFTGGSQFQVHLADGQKRDSAVAEKAVADAVKTSPPRVTELGATDIRVQTSPLDDAESQAVTASLAKAFDVEESEISYSLIGAAWGQDITRQAVVALIVFILFATVVMALYFRTWKMSVAAMVALFHDLVITAGIYLITGFEITPAAMIGFLTILGYSLYDTVVVFDKIRENTLPGEISDRSTYAEAVNLGVNQTLVRSINTSVVALLPVASILFIGAFVLGAGTLRDISLALFIGIFAGAYSTIFVAAPVYAQLRQGEPAIKERDAKVLKARANEAEASEEMADAESTD